MDEKTKMFKIEMIVFILILSFVLMNPILLSDEEREAPEKSFDPRVKMEKYDRLIKKISDNDFDLISALYWGKFDFYLYVLEKGLIYKELYELTGDDYDAEAAILCFKEASEKFFKEKKGIYYFKLLKNHGELYRQLYEDSDRKNSEYKELSINLLNEAMSALKGNPGLPDYNIKYILFLDDLYEITEDKDYLYTSLEKIDELLNSKNTKVRDRYVYRMFRADVYDVLAGLDNREEYLMKAIEEYKSAIELYFKHKEDIKKGSSQEFVGENVKRT